MNVSMQDPKIHALIGCVRREMTYEAAAEELGVSLAVIQGWEERFLSAGISAVVGAAAAEPAQATQELSIRQDKLEAISHSLRCTLDMDQLLQAVLKALYEDFGYVGSICLIQGSHLLVKRAQLGADGLLTSSDYRAPISTASGVIGWVAANGAPLIAQNLSDDTALLYQEEGAPVRSELAVPVINNGMVLGVLDIRSKEVKAFGPDDLSLLEALAARLSTTVENALQFETARRRLKQLELIQSVTSKVVENLGVQSLLRISVQTIRDETGYSAVSVGLVSEDRQSLDLITAHESADGGTATSVHRITIDKQTISGSAAQLARLMLVNDVRQSSVNLRPLMPTSQAALAVPIRSGATLIGLLNVESDQPGAFDNIDLTTMMSLADHLSIALRGAGFYEQVQAHMREISLFRRLADEAIVGIMTRTLDDVIDYANPAAARLFDYPDAAAMQGMPVRALYPNDSWFEVDQQRCLQATRSGGWSGEATQKRRDDQSITTAVSIFPIHAPDGTLTAYGMVVQDVTERQRLSDAIQQTNARLEAILQASQDGIVAWDDSWRVMLANPAACRLLGVSLDQLIGQSPTDTRAPAQLALIVNAKEDERIEFPGDPRRVASCSNVRWQSGRAAGYLTVIYDITDQVSLEKEREELIQMLVHDLRGPLSSIATSLDLAQTCIQENTLDDALEVIALATRSSQSLLTMTNSLLDIAKLESGELKPQLAPVNVSKLLEDTLYLQSTTAQAANIKLSATVADDLPVLVADRDWLNRALANLLDNALKFTPDGGQVELRADPEGDTGIRLSVLDTGGGVPEAFRQRIFEKYVQVPGQTTRRRGTGLGLAFCKLVAEAHHGRLWVERRPGGGSIFALVIPGPQENHPA